MQVYPGQDPAAQGHADTNSDLGERFPETNDSQNGFPNYRT